MNKIIRVLTLCLLATSCSKSTFQNYYKQEKENAHVAMALPKYLLMLFIPSDTKKDIKYFSKGMSKVRLLYYGTSASPEDDFHSFAKYHDYQNYCYFKEDGDKVEVFSLEDEGAVKEIVLGFKSDLDNQVLIALVGRIEKDDFSQRLNVLLEDSKR